MATTDLWRMAATDLSIAIRSKQVSPVEIMTTVLDRIEHLNPKINAFLDVDAERAIETARAAEAAVMRDDELGLLHGLPVSIKDLEPSAGLRYTSGSILYKDRIADVDGIVTERVKAAGGIVTGKTNTPHVGHKDMCDNLLGDPGRNPWHLERTCGGSSGGAAASVAAGLGPLAHGTDGAGSIRIPAALCGVFGLKPSFGRVARWPAGDFWTARSHSGSITRTVADAALFLAAIAGGDSRDPTSMDTRPDDYIAAVVTPMPALKGLRVAWSADFGYAAVDPQVRRLTEQAAQRFVDFGCHVEAVDPGWDDPRELAAIQWYVSEAAALGASYDQHPEAFEPSLVEMIEAGRRISGEAHGLASIARTSFYQQAHDFFEGYDLLLSPQMPLGAWPVDVWPTEIDGQPTPSMFDRLNFTFPFNLTGQPAASVPCGFTDEGVPVALQIVGRWHADTLVLQAAAALEQVAPWADKWPELD